MTGTTPNDHGPTPARSIHESTIDDGTLFRAQDSVSPPPGLKKLLIAQAATIWPLSVATVALGVLTGYRVLPWWPGRIVVAALAVAVLVAQLRFGFKLRPLVQGKTAVNATDTPVTFLAMLGGFLPSFFALTVGFLAAMGSSPAHSSLLSFLIVPTGMIVFSIAVSRHRAPPSCATCGYELVGLDRSTERCPECGATLAGHVVYFKRRVRPWAIAVGAIAFLAPTALMLSNRPAFPPPVTTANGAVVSPHQPESWSERLVPTFLLVSLAPHDGRAMERALGRDIDDETRSRLIDTLVAPPGPGLRDWDRRRMLEYEDHLGNLLPHQARAVVAWLGEATLDGVIDREGERGAALVLSLPVGGRTTAGVPTILFAVRFTPLDGGEPITFTRRVDVTWSTLQFGDAIPIERRLGIDAGTYDTIASVWIVTHDPGAAPSVRWSLEGEPPRTTLPEPVIEPEPVYEHRIDREQRVTVTDR